MDIQKLKQDIKAGYTLGLADALILREALARLEKAESQLAEPIYQMRLLDGEENCSEWIEVTKAEYNTPTTERYGTWERREVFTRAAPPAPFVVKVPDDGLDDCIRDWPGLWRNNFDCGYNYASWRWEQEVKKAGGSVAHE